MKANRIIAFITVLALALTMCVIPASAEVLATFAVEADDVKAGNDTVVKVTGTVPTAGFSVLLSYNATYLTFKTSASTCNVTATDDGNGTVTLAYENLNGADLSGTLVEVTFTAAAESVLEEASKSEDNLEYGLTYELSNKGKIRVFDKGGVNYTEEQLSFTPDSAKIKVAHKVPEVAVTIDDTTPTVGQTLEASVAITDNWDLTDSDPDITWEVGGVEAGTGATYLVKAEDATKTIVAKAAVEVDADENQTGSGASEATSAVEYDATAKASVAGVGLAGDAIVNKAVAVTYDFTPSVNKGTDASIVAATGMGDSTFADGKLTVGLEDFKAAKVITITVTPKGSNDTATGEVKTFEFNCSTAKAGNMRPAATVTFKAGEATVTEAGSAVMGTKLAVTFVYEDINAEGASVADSGLSTVEFFKKAETPVSLGKVAVLGTTGATLDITKDILAVGDVVYAVVTPISADGAENKDVYGEGADTTTGEAVKTAELTVAANAAFAPTVANVAISGGAVVIEDTFKVTYDFEDKNGYAEGATVIELYKEAGDVDTLLVKDTDYTVAADGSITVLKDKALVAGDEVYAKVTPVKHADAGELTYDPAIAAVTSIEYEVFNKKSGGSAGMTGPVLGGGGSKPSTTPTTSPEPTTTPEPTDAPVVVPAAKDCITLTIGKADVNVFGETKANDVAPIIRNDRTMLPARIVAEALGAEVAWDGEARKVTITKGDVTIVITIDADKALVNGEEVALDSHAFIEKDRTYLPMRFLGEKLGAEVTWNGATQEVYIVPAK